MSNNFFSFKQFTVSQSRSAMKVGTDGVLLGAWCNGLNEEATSYGRMLDIGCGTGLIALMLAQRFERAVIDAIDIDADCYFDASDNVSRSRWSDRINVRHISLLEFAQTTSERYDHIVSNPPYFINSLTSSDSGRTKARHTCSLPFCDLINSARRLLVQGGHLSVILPAVEALIFEQEALRCNFTTSRRLSVYPTPTSEIRRIAMEFCLRKEQINTIEINSESRDSSEVPQEDSLVIESTGRHQYSDQYRALTADFYLKF